MSAESPRQGRAGLGGLGGMAPGLGAGGGPGAGMANSLVGAPGGPMRPLTVPPQPPADRSLIDAVSGFISDVTLSASPPDHKDTIQWARFETADINEPTPEGDNDELSPLLLVLGYGTGVQVWLIPPNGEAQEVLSWRQGQVRVLRILPTPEGPDSFAGKRPLIALCDSASPGATFCSLSFISIRGGDQVKSIKFKNPILDVLANKRSVVVSFSERFAVFCARSLEDRVAVTTCYPSPCPAGAALPLNPLALGDRWIAYADRKLNPSKRSSGGCEAEGVSSYTATVLHAAKSLGAGLRGLGESVASRVAGAPAAPAQAPPRATHHPGLVTVLDIMGPSEEEGTNGAREDETDGEGYESMVAHFVAHSDAIAALQWDSSGLVLITADRRGHDFHVFRINPHPCGPALASVHHLYILHRGDTTAKVQDIAVCMEGRWAAVSTLRGTTHVFALSVYGGAVTVRTHAAPRVVNRLSRFHRSAGLHHHSHSPVRDSCSGSSCSGSAGSAGAWYPNPRLPPYPAPLRLQPLAQLRPHQPPVPIPTHTITRNSAGRQRLSSTSEEGGAPLLARAAWGWPACPQHASSQHAGAQHASSQPARASVAYPLYLITASGNLLHYLVTPKPASNVAREKVSDETGIEAEVELVCQWALGRAQHAATAPLAAPLAPAASPLLVKRKSCGEGGGVSEEERWLSQVEIVTHAGPHRRLWMGPQFVFKTYNSSTGSSSSLSEAETVDVVGGGGPSAGGPGSGGTGSGGPARSNPVNMPQPRPYLPVLIHSGSTSSLEHSPSETYRRKANAAPLVCDVQLKEDLAEAMREEQGRARRDGQRSDERESEKKNREAVHRAVDPQGTVVVPEDVPVPALEDPDLYTQSNDDEALFRPVVRAPASIPPDVVVRPLPTGTRIPVETVTANKRISPENEFMPLKLDIVIPAALTLDDAVNNAEEELGVELKPAVVVETADTESNVKIDDKSNISDVNLNYCSSDSLKESSRYVNKTRLSKSPVKIVNNQIVDSLPKLNEPLETNVQHDGDDKIRKSPTPKRYSEKNDSKRESKASERKNESRRSDKKKDKINSKIENLEITVTLPSMKAKIIKQEIETEQESSSEIVEPKPDDCVPDVTNKNSDNIELNIVPDKKEFSGNSFPDSGMFVAESNIESSTFACSIIKPDEKPISDISPDKVIDTDEVTGADEANETIKLSDAKQGKSESNSNPSADTQKSKELPSIEDQLWDMLSEDTKKQNDNPVAKVLDEPKKSKRNRNRNKNKSIEEMSNMTSKPEIIKIDCSHFEQASAETPKLDVNQYSNIIITDSKNPWKMSNATENTEEPGLAKDSEINNYESAIFDKFSEIDFPEFDGGQTKKYEPFNITTVKENVDVFEDALANEIVPYVCKSRKIKSEKQNLYVPELTEKKLEVIDTKLSRKSPKSVKKSIISNKPDLIYIEPETEEVPDIKVVTTTNKDTFVDVDCSLILKPKMSWSAVAGTSKKSIKEAHEEKSNDLVLEKKKEVSESPSEVINLCNKLTELCKTDVLVAQCDAPDELEFVEGHHSLIDLPPLEPLDFALDEFKLEVMRDSLLEDTKLTSPICKINIDDILSTIKDSAIKTMESSSFDLVSFDKPKVKKRDKMCTGFNIVDESDILLETKKIGVGESDKFIDKLSDVETVEKSSDDDNISPVSSQTDSDDKDDKKTGPEVIPAQKGSAKKKPRRNKKK